MSSDPSQQSDSEPSEPREDGGLEDMHQELRILLQGVQVLTGFLIVLPFNEHFSRISRAEQWVYLATFCCSLSSLVLLSAPAAQHRLERPLRNRIQFKHHSKVLIVTGTAFLSMALILATQLVVSEVIGDLPGLIVAGIVGLLIAVLWWVIPIVRRRKDGVKK